MSLMVPITNSLAFLFTVLGEWFAQGKVIDRSEYLKSSMSTCTHDMHRDLDGYGFGTGWHCLVCSFEEYLIIRGA